MLNAAQFSAAKSAAEAKLIQAEVFDEKKQVRTYTEFEKAAKQVADISQKTWLRVEYESQRRAIVMGEQFRQMMEDKELYPYWVYKGMMDDRERPEHVELEGKVFRIGDPEGDSCWPPNDWNCLEPESLVLTAEGWKQINQLKTGETVIGGSGYERKINFIHCNPFNGDMIGLVTKNNTVFYTGNHRVLTTKGWIAAERLNRGDILIQHVNFTGFDKIVIYVKNCYSFGRNIFMALPVKWQARMVETFNSKVNFRDKNINPIWLAIKVVNRGISQFFNITYCHTFRSSRFCSCVNVQNGIDENISFSCNSRLSNDFRIKKTAFNLLPFRLKSKPFTGKLSFAKIRMRGFGNILANFIAGLFLPFFCIYPLGLYCIASVSDWYFKLFEKLRDNSIIRNIPALAKLSESMLLNRIQFVKNHTDAAPLQGLNSRYMFLYRLFCHNLMIGIDDVKIKKYNGIVYNLDIDTDVSFITKTGIVHNCRCEGESVDDDYLGEKGLKPATSEEINKFLDEDVDEQFRSNPAVDGSLPSTGSYFDVMGSANEGNAGMFGMDDIDDDTQLEGLAAKGLHYLLEIVNDWRDNEPVNKKGDIIFQNKELFTNVRFTSNSLHVVQKHSRGFENIPAAVKQPDEVWSTWEDVNKQRVVLRNYIKFGKTSYVVQTRDGIVIDAFAVSNRAANKYRKGVIL
jgi:hypothetical protein